MAKTLQEINEKIRTGAVVVVTAEEMIEVVAEKGAAGAAAAIDVVTTGTFGLMCSSGLMMNLGHSQAPHQIGRRQGDAEPRAGLYRAGRGGPVPGGHRALRTDDPRNAVYPGEFRYGGGHVIEDLVAGKSVLLEAEAYGTDCYPRKQLATWIALEELNEAYLFNPRNAYQNYNVAVNRARPHHLHLHGHAGAESGLRHLQHRGPALPALQ